MVPSSLQKKLYCLECENSSLNFNELDSEIECLSCNTKYPLNNGIPSMMKGGPDEQDWNPWDLDRLKMIGDSYYKRSVGELPEKESSKSYANLLNKKCIYKKGESYLDIGCATGHFLKSFRRIVDEDFNYTGIDATPHYLQWGAEIFGLSDNCSFVHCDTLNLPFKDKSFDNVIVNLFHFFPRVDEALKEVFRVCRGRVIWRTPIGEINYMCKMIYNDSFQELGVLTPERNDFDHSVYMIYSKPYIKDLIESLGAEVEFIERDEDFEAFDNTSLEEMRHFTSTKTVGGMQVNGNLILDWQYISIDCRNYKGQ